MSTVLTIRASSERPSIWERTVSQQLEIAKRFFGLAPKLPPTSPNPAVKPLPRYIFHTVKANNKPAIKQLNDLITESRAVAHAEIAVLSKPTPKYTKDRIFEFVETANRPVSVAEIAQALPDVAKSGVSSRVSEMRHAGSLWVHYRHDGNGTYTLTYTVAETK